MHETLRSGPSHPQVSGARKSRPSSRPMEVPSSRMHSQEQGSPPDWSPRGQGWFLAFSWVWRSQSNRTQSYSEQPESGGCQVTVLMEFKVRQGGLTRAVPWPGCGQCTPLCWSEAWARRSWVQLFAVTTP